MSFIVCDILGVPINNININEAIGLVSLYIEENNVSEPKMIFTPNPEFVINALNDEYFMQILNSSTVNIADGIGIVIASKILGYPLKERVAGYDLTQSIFQLIKNKNKTVYFLGSNKETILKAKRNMSKKYKGLKIVGARDGYFTKDEEQALIYEINELKPDIILVGLGSPKQEKWIFENRDKIKTKLMIGVGGSFDVMSGNVKRAPKIFVKLHLEWFYRLLKQPSRFKRTMKLPLFIIKVLQYKFKRR